MKYDRYLTTALATAYELNFDDAIETLLHHGNWISNIVRPGGSEPLLDVDEAEQCTKANVYDQPKVIDQILELVIQEIKSNYFANKPIVCDMLRRLSRVCDTLQKQDNKKPYIKSLSYSQSV